MNTKGIGCLLILRDGDEIKSLLGTGIPGQFIDITSGQEVSVVGMDELEITFFGD